MCFLKSAVVVVLLCSCATIARAQVAPADSLGRDTLYTALPDTVARVRAIDPVRPYFPAAAPFGSIVPATSPDAARIVSELALASMRYFTAFDVLRRFTPALPLSQGSPGLVRALSYAGASPDAVGVSYNGRPLEGLAAYGYDLELYPMEFAERTEIVTGARALVYGTGEALMAVNFVQPRLDVEATYMRAWYAQDAGDLTGGDLMYARNLDDRANVSLGFRRLTTGNDVSARFANQELSNWAVHANATWRPVPSLMLSLTELFADATRSQNEGLTPESSRNPLSVEHQVYNTSWQERTLRHDVTLAAEWLAGGPRNADLDSVLSTGDAAASIDSAIRVDAALYGSFGSRQLEAGDSVIDDGGGVLRTERTRVGVRAGAWVPLSFARLETNAIIELAGARDRDQATASYALGRQHVGALLEFPIGGGLALRGSARYTRGREGQFIGGAGEITSRIGSRIIATAGARVQTHECPCEEPMRSLPAFQSSVYESTRTSFMAEASIAYQDSATLLSLMAYARQARPAGAAADTRELMTTGGELRARVPFWILALEAHAHGILLPENARYLPQARVYGDLFAPLNLLDGSLDLRIGTTLEYQTPMAGSLYGVVTGSFVRTPDDAPVFAQVPLWDAYAQARIGTAYLRLALRNILDVEAWSLYRYPERGRSFWFEVTWSFID